MVNKSSKQEQVDEEVTPVDDQDDNEEEESDDGKVKTQLPADDEQVVAAHINPSITTTTSSKKHCRDEADEDIVADKPVVNKSSKQEQVDEKVEHVEDQNTQVNANETIELPAVDDHAAIIKHCIEQDGFSKNYKLTREQKSLLSKAKKLQIMFDKKTAKLQKEKLHTVKLQEQLQKA